MGKTSTQKSQYAQVWDRFRRKKSAMIGLVLVILLALCAIFADFFIDYDVQIAGRNLAERFLEPSLEHLCGTDDFGRDIFLRILYGARYSIGIGLGAVALALSLGILLGSVAGYYGGYADMGIMRVMDVFMAVPQLLLSMIIAAVAGNSIPVMMFALGIASVPQFARITRGAVLTVCEAEFIEAAKALGEGNGTIILRHILPNCFAPLLVQTTLTIATTILSVSGLSYLGLGIETPIPEWGSMLSASRQYMGNYSYMSIFPGLAIMLTILALNLIGDGFRDAADPKQK